MRIAGEAVASCRMDGIGVTHGELLQRMIMGAPRRRGDGTDALGDAEAAARSLRHTLDATDQGSDIGLHDIARAHELLFEGRQYAQGSESGHVPGELRRVQDTAIEDGDPDTRNMCAPPAPDMVGPLMENLVEYVNLPDCRDADLVRCAVAHCQFEAISPFMGGNGRVGRIFTALLMRKYGLLTSQVLDLSEHFGARQTEYRSLLRGAAGSGAWPAWIAFFLDACELRAGAGLRTMTGLAGLHAEYVARMLTVTSSPSAARIVDMLFENPCMTVPAAKQAIGLGNRSTTHIVGNAIKAGILERVPSGTKTVVYAAREVLDIMGEGCAGNGPGGPDGHVPPPAPPGAP